MDGIAHLLRNAHIQVTCPHCDEDVFVDTARLGRDPVCQCSACRHTFALDPGMLLESFKNGLSTR